MFMHRPKLLSFFALVYWLELLNTTHLSAQSEFSYSPDLSFRVEKAFLKNNSFHPVIKPYSLSIGNRQLLLDSIYPADSGKKKDMLARSGKNYTLIANPVLQSSFRAHQSLEQHYVMGIALQSEWGKKVSIQLNYSLHGLTRSGFENTRTDSAGIAYSLGRVQKVNANYYLGFVFNGNITFQANRFLSFQLGKDRHFWGDGYRSLFISDNAPSFPYFNTTVQIWKLRYSNMVAVMNDYVIGNYTKRYQKYSSMHIISWNATKRLNVSLFEAVVWARNDTVSHRSLDINYLNPFVFYRPQEYTLGSPDNMLMGVGLRYRILNDTHLYGQFMLDEFYLKEIMAEHKWWANKHALQLGFKVYDLFGIRDFYLQLEYNHARPFTYGHSTSLENFGSLLQPLAHPAGGNFREGLGIVRYAKGRWSLNSFVSYLKYGAEPGGKSVGTDIYISSNQRAKDYGNFISQGILTRQLVQEFTVSRVLQPHWGLAAQGGFRNVIQTSTESLHQFYLLFGLKTNLYRDEKLF
jgi:hypothetical protein